MFTVCVCVCRNIVFLARLTKTLCVERDFMPPGLDPRFLSPSALCCIFCKNTLESGHDNEISAMPLRTVLDLRYRYIYLRCISGDSLNNGLTRLRYMPCPGPEQRDPIDYVK